MEERLHSWWQKIRQHPFITAGTIVALLVLIIFILAAYRLDWDWTGFNSGKSQITITSTSKGTFIAEELQPAKTLWDWLNLLGVLAIPAVVGLGAAWYTAQQGKVSDKENIDNQREIALQAYIDKMSELLLEKNLRGSAENDEVRKIARVRTLTVLRGLDVRRKGNVLQFLYESGLIEKETRIIALRGADLRGADLHGADLHGAHLGGVDLREADLRRADLREITVRDEKMAFSAGEGGYVHADLRGADLRHAELGGADLCFVLVDGANLSGASLKGADLSGIDLRSADLRGTSFRGANLYEGKITPEQEKMAGSFRHATMPDGSKRH